MKSPLVLILVALGVFVTVQGVREQLRAHAFRTQEARMHIVAYRHPQANNTLWKHDERQLLKDAADHENRAIVELTIALLCGLIIAAMWQRQTHPYSIHVPSWNPPAYRATQRLTSVGPILGTVDIANAEEETPEMTLEEKRKQSGREGEQEIFEALAPLFSAGWTLLASNPIVHIDEKHYGDIDFIVRSPNGVGFSIDAKNGNCKVWVHDKCVYFKHRWYNGKARQYPLERAWFLADWVQEHGHEQLGFEKLKIVVPVIALCKSMVPTKGFRERGWVTVALKQNLCSQLVRLDQREIRKLEWHLEKDTRNGTLATATEHPQTDTHGEVFDHTALDEA